MQKTLFKIAVFGLFFSLFLLSCKSSFKEKWTKEEAPSYFTAKFETTQGDFVIESEKAWSPEGVNRLYQLIKHDYFTDMAVFRVVPDFVAQFGINNDSTLTSAWRSSPVIDEPVKESNVKGAMSFARSSEQTRTHQLFINLKSNAPRLDTIHYNNVTGFPVVAKVVSGMDVVESFYDGYGSELGNRQDSINRYGNDYLHRNYPKIDYIKKAYILEKKK